MKVIREVVEKKCHDEGALTSRADRGETWMAVSGSISISKMDKL